MQSSQKLIRTLLDLVALVEEEATRNPSFAARLEAITADLPAKASRKRPRSAQANQNKPPPDVFSAFQTKGEEEFRFWLRSLDIPLLKAIIKVNGFDPGKASQRWTEPDKFIDLIATQTAARLRRGSIACHGTPRQRIVTPAFETVLHEAWKRGRYWFVTRRPTWTVYGRLGFSTARSALAP
jgi:hypothetical protein